MIPVIQNLFSDQLVNSISYMLLHSLWQGPVVALVMYFWLRRHKDRPAYYRYNIGVAAMLLIFVLALFTFSFYLLKNTGGVAQEEQTILILTAPQTGLSAAGPEMSSGTWLALL